MRAPLLPWILFLIALLGLLVAVFLWVTCVPADAALIRLVRGTAEWNSVAPHVWNPLP